MQENRLAFLPPRDSHFYLLQGHRQPLPENVVRRFIEELTEPGDLVIDPFAASDIVARVAVERGRRALLADSNPLVAFAARGQATLPAPREITGALVRLGEIPKDDETLQAHLARLYTSECAGCSSPVDVDYFINRRDGERVLVAEKVYACPECGTRRDDATEQDRQQAAAVPAHSLHYHLLVQRLVAQEAQQSALVHRLLDVYTPRNLYALALLTQKLDAEFRDDPARKLVDLFMLHALDAGSSLYPAPAALPTREVPPEFIEVNIWRALERAAVGLAERAPGLRPALRAAHVVEAQNPLAFIGQGGARALAEAAPGANAALVLSSPARLDPAFWELSFFWARWLLGKHAAAPLEPLLDEKRQRWGWYGSALTNALEDTAALMRDSAPLVVAFPSGSHAMIEALLLAGSPQFTLDGLAFRPARGATGTTEFGALRGDYCVLWHAHPANPPPRSGQEVAPRIREGAMRGALEILASRAEPLAYSWVHHNALDRLARDGVLAETSLAKLRANDNALQFLRHRLEEGLKQGYAHDLDHVPRESGVLWMRRTDAGVRRYDLRSEETRSRGAGDEDDSGTTSPLAEQVEEFIRAGLQTQSRVAATELEDAVLNRFPGLLTPEIELVELCAAAYADRSKQDWVWRAEDSETFLTEAREQIDELGERMGFRVHLGGESSERVWRVEKVVPGSSGGGVAETRVLEDAYVFIFRTRADFRELVARPATPLRGFVVIPESQVALTAERLRRDPVWIKRIERAGWEFLRLPFVVQLLGEELAERPEFKLAWGLEPALAKGKEQLTLL